METYKFAEEIRIYEDRQRHVKGFRDFFTEYNRKQNGVGGSPTRGPIVTEVVPVADISTTLNPVVEVAEVQHMINGHNEAVSKLAPRVPADQARRDRLMIKKTVHFTGYMIDKADTARLLQLAQLPSGIPGQDLKMHANNVLICPRPCPASILDKVGGMGSKMKWEVTGTACFENSIWAACLKPVPAAAKFHTDNPSPLVVLAVRKGSRPNDAGKIQNWQPVPPDKAYVIETTVGEKVILRIEPEDPREDEYESLFANKSSKRKHAADDEYPRQHGTPHGYDKGGRGGEARSYHTSNYQGGRGGQDNRGRGGYRGGGTPNRGYRNGPRGNGKGGGRGGRGGGGHGYRSLDDVEPRNAQGGYGGYGAVDYDDSHSAMPPQGQYQPPQQQYQAQYSAWAPQAPSGPAQQPQGGRPMGGGQGYGASGSDLQNYY
jgi:hypothetical protein